MTLASHEIMIPVLRSSMAGSMKKLAEIAETQVHTSLEWEYDLGHHFFNFIGSAQLLLKLYISCWIFIFKITSTNFYLDFYFAFHITKDFIFKNFCCFCLWKCYDVIFIVLMCAGFYSIDSIEVHVQKFQGRSFIFGSMEQVVE